ncbi:D-glucuronyl C5-epimerase C-terminus [Halomonas sp. HL-93]|nr:D-glucuronyl C5-epimerase C-terminus [Halomonas sp. HL-93]
MYHKHYSGLTQSYYAEILYRVGERLNDPTLIDAADRVFESLTIPVEEGGVLHNSAHGPVIAEVPQEPNSWILNGWQSALESVHRYAEISDSDKAQELFEESTEAMAAMLHLYDVADLANSRYGLTGFVYLRINPAGSGVSLKNTAIEIPGEPSVPVESTEGSRWQSYFFEGDTTPMENGVEITGSSARLNAVLSMASAPESNRLEFDFNASTTMEITVDIYVGSYDPLSSAPVDAEWVQLAKLTATPGERVSIDIPVEFLDKVAYPTNFVKQISGEQVNVYHSIHVMRLRQLADASGTEELRDWADLWEGYICRWAGMKLYDDYKARDYKAVGEQLIDPQEVCSRLE